MCIMTIFQIKMLLEHKLCTQKCCSFWIHVIKKMINFCFFYKKYDCVIGENWSELIRKWIWMKCLTR